MSYSKLTGYNPVTGANDDGYNIRDMLNYWKSTGLYGHKILCYASVNYKDPDEVAIAQWLGCGVIGGFQLPTASQKPSRTQGRQLWYVPKWLAYWSRVLVLGVATVSLSPEHLLVWMRGTLGVTPPVDYRLENSVL